MSTIRQRKEIARLTAPLPPIEQTIAKLNTLSLKQYETKARFKRAIKNSHLALVYILENLEAYSKYPNLVSKTTVETIHREIIHRLNLNEV